MNGGNFNPKLNRRTFMINAGLAAAAGLLPDPAEAFQAGASYFQTRKGWIPTSTTSPLGARSQGDTVSVGNQIFIFGGSPSSGAYTPTPLAGWYDPALNSWQAITATGTAPIGRVRFCIATNGTTVFIFGGSGAAGRLNSGGVFTPSGAAGGAWVPTTATGAPTIRQYSRAVAVGSKYIVWGGVNGATYYNDGAIYDPALDSWTAIPAPGSPTIGVRSQHALVSTGTKMLLWGGFNGTAGYADGFIYDVACNSWTQMSACPISARWGIGACWTGTKMFVYGGGAPNGALYDLASNTWTQTSLTGTPATAGASYAFWTGSKIVVMSDALGIGVYDPAIDVWLAPSEVNGPTSAISNYYIGYANHRLFIWAGFNTGNVRQNTGFIYYHPEYF